MDHWDYLNVRTQGNTIIGVDQPKSAHYTHEDEWKGKQLAAYLSALYRAGWDLYGFQQSTEGERSAIFFLKRYRDGSGGCRGVDELARA